MDRNFIIIFGLTIGIISLIKGIITIIFKKFPLKSWYLKKLSLEYESIDEDRICKVLGVYDCIFGIIWIITGAISITTNIYFLCIGVMLCVAVVFDINRKKLFKLERKSFSND